MSSKKIVGFSLGCPGSAYRGASVLLRARGDFFEVKNHC